MLEKSSLQDITIHKKLEASKEENIKIAHICTNNFELVLQKNDEDPQVFLTSISLKHRMDVHSDKLDCIPESVKMALLQAFDKRTALVPDCISEIIVFKDSTVRTI